MMNEESIELMRGIDRKLDDYLLRSFPFEAGRRPYPGFASLEEKDTAIFFGRDAQIVRGLDKIRSLVRAGVDRMLVVLGASGSGKSSFFRAGLWPRLKRDDRTWLPLPTIRPERAVISGKSATVRLCARPPTGPPGETACSRASPSGHPAQPSLPGLRTAYAGRVGGCRTIRRRPTAPRRNRAFQKSATRNVLPAAIRLP